VSSHDPEQVLHDAPCLECGARIPVQLSRTRLEKRPWRLAWTCIACERLTTFPAPDDLIPAMLELQRAGGVAISEREVREFVGAGSDEFEAALREELLP
jgi:hypothetical protein